MVVSANLGEGGRVEHTFGICSNKTCRAFWSFKPHPWTTLIKIKTKFRKKSRVNQTSFSVTTSLRWISVGFSHVPQFHWAPGLYKGRNLKGGVRWPKLFQQNDGLGKWRGCTGGCRAAREKCALPCLNADANHSCCSKCRRDARYHRQLQKMSKFPLTILAGQLASIHKSMPVLVTVLIGESQSPWLLSPRLLPESEECKKNTDRANIHWPTATIRHALYLKWKERKG